MDSMHSQEAKDATQEGTYTVGGVAYKLKPVAKRNDDDWWRMYGWFKQRRAKLAEALKARQKNPEPT